MLHQHANSHPHPSIGASHVFSQIDFRRGAVWCYRHHGHPGRQRAGRRHYRRGRHFSLSDLRQVGRGLQDQDRYRHELSVDRLRRRHQADPGQDRGFRRVRQAAYTRRTEQIGADAVPGHYRRRGADREYRRREAGRNEIDRPGRRRYFSGQDKELGRQGDHRSQSRPETPQ